MQPSPAEIQAYFRLDPDTGKVYVRNPRCKKWLTMPVGKVETDGYVRIKYKGKWYAAGRVVWVLFTGVWPSNSIDHINRDRKDNRPANLRDVSTYVNEMNKDREVIGNIGHPGISLAAGAKYRVTKHAKYLGSFNSFALAKHVYDNYAPVE